MQVSHDPEGEIRITDNAGIILLKFYECTDGYLVSYDEGKVVNANEVNFKEASPKTKEVI